MKGLWVIWWMILFFGVIHVLTGGQQVATFCVGVLVVNAIQIATRIIVEEVKAKKES